MADSLAVKYRPQKFEDVVSQSSIVKILTRQIELNEVHNSYLFTGMSGSGKTTCARIFASMINKITYQKNMPGVIEIDAASNNGVDNVREIVKSASERSLESRYKVYIIDECHSLTSQSWQAFLKCIEEPPAFTIFIFCTTDPQKIPATILNRCMRFNFCRIPADMIRNRLLYICSNEGYTSYEDTCDYISKIADGGMRNAISILEKCSSYSTELSVKNCLTALGNYSYDSFFTLLDSLIDGNENHLIQLLDIIHMEGGDLKLFINQFIDFCLDLCKYIMTQDFSICKIPSNFYNKVKANVEFSDAGKYYNYLLDRLMQLRIELRDDDNPLMTSTIYLMKVARCE